MRVNERKLAGVVLMVIAGTNAPSFSASSYYDDDMETLTEIIRMAGIEKEPLDRNKERVRRVCRRLAKYGIFTTVMKGTQKEYIGEPVRQQNYWFANHSHVMRLRPDLYPLYKPDYTPEFELNYLLDCCYGEREE